MAREPIGRSAARTMLAAGVVAFLAASPAIAGRCCDGCPGRGAGHGGGAAGDPGPGSRAGMPDAGHQSDMELFHFLMDNGSKIRRSVDERKDGVETVTESDDPAIAETIKEHVSAMVARMKSGRPIHMRDPLFRALFENASKVRMSVEETEKGVRVQETSEDPWVAKVIQSHATVVSGFIANGRAEAMSDHEVPSRH